MKKIVSRVVAFYKESILDIYGYLKYMIRQLIKYNLIVIIVTVICCLVYLFLSDTVVNYFFGVIISVIAAILFEGYRSYRKFLDSKLLLNFGCKDFKNALKEFCRMYICSGELVPLQCITDVKVYKLYDQSCSEIISQVIKMFEKYEKLKIYLKGDDYLKEERYYQGIVAYELFVKYIDKYLYKAVDRCVDIIVKYSDDTQLIIDFYELRNRTYECINNKDIISAFKRGNFSTTYHYLIRILKLIEKLDNEIECRGLYGEVKK